jgi:hypothetical protein
MRVEQGARLRAQWSAKGHPTCQHETLSLEQSVRKDLTGAYICTECGELFKSRLWLSSETER